MDLIGIAGIVSAITVIVGAVIKLYNFMKKLDDRLDRFESDIRANTIHTLKLALFSEELPISERIHAGEKYIELGGNGAGKVLYNKLVKEYTDELDKR